MNRAHKIRLYPTKTQEVLLNKTAGVVRYAYNWGLEQWEAEYKDFKEGRKDTKPTHFNLLKRWVREKPDWAREVAAKPQQRAFINLGIAYNNFFKKRADRPTFHKKVGRQSFYCPNDSVKWFANSRISLPGIGRVRLAEPLRFSGRIMSYTVSGYAGQWWVSVMVEMQDVQRPCIDPSPVGIDVGFKTPAVASDGTTLELPKRTLKKLKRKLKHAQRALARSKKASKRREKKLRRKQKLELKLSNIRQDVTHKFTTTICKNHAVVVIEDLDIEGMKEKATYRSFRRAFNESIMEAIHYQLGYKAVKLIKAPRYYPSTKLCSACGSIKDAMPPSVRVYECEHCGAILDRDANASRNLMKLGMVSPEA